MSFSHLYYTSARGEYFGFQVYATTRDIDKDEEESRIVKVSSYELPPKIKSLEREVNIEQFAPKKFAFYLLKTGRYAMTYSSYCGLDYSGRNGNYFSDTVVFKKGALKGRPIEYFESSAFKTYLLPGEGDVQTGYLVSEPKIDKGEVITLERVKRFIQSPGNIDIFKTLLQAAFEYPETGKSIIIIDDVVNIAYWIAAIQYSFPEKHAWSLPFTTYTHTFDYQEAAIYGVYQETIADASWSRKYHVFDIARDRLPSLTANSYVEQVVALYNRDLNELLEFLKFVDLVANDEMDASLEGIMPLYHFVHSPTEDIPERELQKGLKLYLNIEEMTTLRDLSESIVKKITADDNDCFELYNRIPNELVPELSLKWFEIGKTHVGIKQLAVQFFYTSWENLLIDDRNDQFTAEYAAFADEIFNRNKGIKAFHEKGYHEDRLSVLLNIVSEEPRQALWDAWMLNVLRHLKENDVKLENAVPQKRWLLEMLDFAVMQSYDLNKVLDIIFESDELIHQLVSIVLKGYDMSNEEELLQRLIDAVLQYVHAKPEHKEAFQQLITKRPIVATRMLQSYRARLKQADKPISELERVLKESDNYIMLSEDDKDYFFGEAADRLIDVQHPAYLSELELLWKQRIEIGRQTWPERLPTETNITLIDLGLKHILERKEISEYIPLLDAWKEMLIDLPQSKASRDSVQKINMAKQLAEMSNQKISKPQMLKEIIGALHHESRNDALQIIEPHIVTFMNHLGNERSTRDQFYSLTMPELRDQIREQIQRSRSLEQSIERIVGYYEYLIVKNIELEEADIVFVKETKNLAKMLKAKFIEQRQESVYTALEEKLGKNASNIGAISGKSKELVRGFLSKFSKSKGEE